MNDALNTGADMKTTKTASIVRLNRKAIGGGTLFHVRFGSEVAGTVVEPFSGLFVLTLNGKQSNRVFHSLDEIRSAL